MVASRPAAGTILPVRAQPLHVTALEQQRVRPCLGRGDDLHLLGGLIGAAILWASPVRRLISLPASAEGDGELPPAPDPLVVAAAVEWDQPPGA
jgi:hypothetical protein